MRQIWTFLEQKPVMRVLTLLVWSVMRGMGEVVEDPGWSGGTSGSPPLPSLHHAGLGLATSLPSVMMALSPSSANQRKITLDTYDINHCKHIPIQSFPIQYHPLQTHSILSHPIYAIAFHLPLWTWREIMLDTYNTAISPHTTSPTENTPSSLIQSYPKYCLPLQSYHSLHSYSNGNSPTSSSVNSSLVSGLTFHRPEQSHISPVFSSSAFSSPDSVVER